MSRPVRPLFPSRFALLVVLALMFAGGLLVGRGTADDRPITYHRDVVQGPEWQIYAVPPCEEQPLSDVAIGLTWKVALKNATNLVAYWPTTSLIVGHDFKHVNKNGKVCP